MLIYLDFALYLGIVLSLLWGRFAFFKMNSGTPFWLALSYDIAVGVQMVSAIYGRTSQNCPCIFVSYCTPFRWCYSGGRLSLQNHSTLPSAQALEKS